MRLATVAVDTAVGERRRLCVPSDDGFVDVTTAHAALLADEGVAAATDLAEGVTPPDMQAFLERGDRAFDAAREAVAYARDRIDDAQTTPTGPDGARVVQPDDEVRLLAPLPRPNSLRDFMAYEEHVQNTMGEVPDVWYDRPVYYKGNPDSVVGPDATVEWPAYSSIMDFELELAAVVGKRGRDIAAEDADEYVAGYTVFDDFSARDTQGEEMEGRLGPAKGKDFANALGPYLVTPDEFDPATATMTAAIDGEVVSEGTPGEMHHSFADIVAYVSQSETLHPGDVLGSGTVGRGCGLELGRFLEDGDEISLTVDGIGTLTNRVVERG